MENSEDREAEQGGKPNARRRNSELTGDSHQKNLLAANSKLKTKYLEPERSALVQDCRHQGFTVHVPECLFAQPGIRGIHFQRNGGDIQGFATVGP